MNIKYGLTAIIGAYLICTFGVSPVMAATITGTIKVNIPDGDFAGIYTGDFAYDDTHLTKVGEEFMTRDGDYQTRSGLLSFNFRFLDFADGLTPVTYTAKDVDSFSDAPVLAFENGIPTQFGLEIFSASGKDGLTFRDNQSFYFALRNGTIGGLGSVTLEITNEPTSVPEKPSPLASLLVFLGLGGFHLWKNSRKANKLANK